MAGIKSFIARHRQGTAFLVLTTVSVILLVITNRNLVIRPKEIGQSFLSVFQISISSVTRWFVNTVNSIGELKQAKEELEEARLKLHEYERISRDIVKLRQENSELKALLSFSEELSYRHVPAEVIARQPGNTFAVVTLNKGSKDGVSRYMPVVARTGGHTGLVGKVISVGLGSCMILPLFNEKSFVAGRLEASRYDGLISGRGDNSEYLIMRNVKKIAIREIEYGDMVVTSGLGGVFPKGIPIGRVRSVRSESYETSLEVEIEPVIEFSKLEYVMILVKENR
jgi:rod shape-determining protein MreC